MFSKPTVRSKEYSFYFVSSCNFWIKPVLIVVHLKELLWWWSKRRISLFVVLVESAAPLDGSWFDISYCARHFTRLFFADSQRPPPMLYSFRSWWPHPLAVTSVIWERRDLVSQDKSRWKGALRCAHVLELHFPGSVAHTFAFFPFLFSYFSWIILRHACY